jgi:hypothetical protein
MRGAYALEREVVVRRSIGRESSASQRQALSSPHFTLHCSRGGQGITNLVAAISGNATVKPLNGASSIA